jgi:phage regulator Rha-like protein
MAELIVSNIGTDADAALVVDSRLLASGLNIEHDNFLQTIQKYETQTAPRPQCPASDWRDDGLAACARLKAKPRHTWTAQDRREWDRNGCR